MSKKYKQGDSVIEKQKKRKKKTNQFLETII